MAGPGGLPGHGTEKTFTPRRVLLTPYDKASFVPANKVLRGKGVDGNNHAVDLHELREGVIVSKVCATGFYVPGIFGTCTWASNTSTLKTTSATVCAIQKYCGVVPPAGSFYVIGASTVSGNKASGCTALCGFRLTAVTSTLACSGMYIRIESCEIGFATGSLIVHSSIVKSAAKMSAGTGQAQSSGGFGLGNSHVLITKGQSIRTVDDDLVSQNTECPDLLAAGVLDTSKILNMPSATYPYTRNWLKNELRRNTPGLVFNDDM